MIKYVHETKPLPFACLARAIYLSVCNVIYKEMTSEISDECCDSGNAIENEESDEEESFEKNSGEH